MRLADEILHESRSDYGAPPLQAHGLDGRKAGSFFKKRKTFIRFVRRPNPPIWTGCWMPLTKVFCFFSSEKKSLVASSPFRPTQAVTFFKKELAFLALGLLCDQSHSMPIDIDRARYM
ncbi:MAG TPA: hypothetical protein VMB71_05590 [Acetobacteraceae bacterium]|nr:hypothetical protein [Acetobacteraceae bacterium]